MIHQNIIIDTRDSAQYKQSHVQGAINITPQECMSGKIPEALQNLPKDQNIIVYCRTGQRANTCKSILQQHGFSHVINGINEQQVNQQLGL